MKDTDNIILWFIRKTDRDQISIHAAQVAFFVFVSMIPFLMFLITLIQYTPLTEDVIMETLKAVLPTSLCSFMDGLLAESYNNASGTVLSVTVIATLWAGSKGFWGIVYEMDKIYEVKNQRNLLVCRILSILYTTVFTFMIIVSLTILVYGNQIALWLSKVFPFLTYLSVVVFWLRSAVSFLLFTIYFLFLYRFVPKRKSKFRDELPGAVLAAFLWIAFSYLYSLYIDYFSNIRSIYGSLTYLVLLMLWLYFCINIVFFGAMLNQYLKKKKTLHLRSSLKELQEIAQSFLGNKK
jgi:membrane protein